VTRAECLISLAAKIAALHFDHPTRVAIDGVDGSGKTTLADELTGTIESLGPRQVIRASIDDFAQPSDIRYRRKPKSGDSYFFDAFGLVRRAVLRSAWPRPSTVSVAAAFDILTAASTPRSAAAVDVLPATAYFTATELDDCWDPVWVDAPSTTVARALARRGARRPVRRRGPPCALGTRPCRPTDRPERRRPRERRRRRGNADPRNPSPVYQSRKKHHGT
jgi:uridine kinase